MKVYSSVRRVEFMRTIEVFEEPVPPTRRVLRRPTSFLFSEHISSSDLILSIMYSARAVSVVGISVRSKKIR